MRGGPGSTVRILVLFIILVALVLLILSLTANDATAEGPDLTVDYPPEGLLTNDYRFYVRGVTEPVTEVEVVVESMHDPRRYNGTSSANGSFAVRVYTFYERHTLIITAGTGDHKTTVTRNITVDRFEPRIEVGVFYENQVPVMFNETLDCYLVSEDEIHLFCRIRDFETSFPDLRIEVNDVPYQGSGEFNGVNGTWPLEEGLNTFVINATDKAGNTGTAMIKVFRDTTPPQLLLDSPRNGELTGDLLLDVEGRTEPHTYIQVQVRSDTRNQTYNASSSGDGSFAVPVLLVEGLQTLVVYAVDAMGNVNMSLALVTLDTTPPEIVLTQPPDGTLTTRESRFSIVGTTDAEAYVTVDDIGVDNTGVFIQEVRLAEGRNEFLVRAVDPVGNEASVTITIMRDTVPPILFVSSPQRTYLVTNSTTLHFAGSVKDSVGVYIRHRGIHYEAQLVSGSWQDGVWEYDLLLEGAEVVEEVKVYAHDRANNMAASSIWVVLDTMPPALNIDGGLVRFTNQDPVRISGTTDEDIDVVTVNGEPHPVTEGVFDLEIGLGGSSRSEFNLAVKDEAGNVATQFVSVTYDTQVPDLKLRYPKETDDRIVTVTGTTDEDVKWVFVDGQSYFVENGTFTFLIELEGEGEHRINFTVEDEAGNRRTKFATIDNGGGIPGFGASLVVLAMSLLVVATGMRRLLGR